jgi:hypothetical protein
LNISECYKKMNAKCRFYERGNCNNGDSCKFYHDNTKKYKNIVEVTKCKYFERGNCNFGDSCKFIHEKSVIGTFSFLNIKGGSSVGKSAFESNYKNITSFGKNYTPPDSMQENKIQKAPLSPSPSSSLSPSLVILITGGREFEDYDTILNELSKYSNEKSVLFIHGACRGADLLGEKAAKSLSFDIDSHPAQWEKYGRSAGPRRNLEMVKLAQSYQIKGIKVVVLAFHENIEASKGTKHTANAALNAGLNVQVFKPSKKDL